MGPAGGAENTLNESSDIETERRKILIVDDDSGVLQFLSLCLTGEGYDVACASNGWEAMELLDLEDCDAVLTDQNMPFMGGLELAGKIKQRIPRLPVILMSGHFWTDVGRSPISGFLAKPFTRRQLLEMLSGIGM